MDAHPLTESEAAEMFRLMALEIEETAIFLMDRNGIITFWNHAAALLKGYSAEEAIGSFFGMLYTTEEQSAGEPARNLRRAVEHGCVREQNWRKKKDGSLFWARIALTALRDEHNQLVGFSKITLDLTKQHELEECIKERDEISRILDATRSGTWTWHPGSDLLCVSPPLAGILGYRPEVHCLDLGQWLDLVHPDDREEVGRAFRSASPTPDHQPVIIELRVTGTRGNYRWLMLKALWCERGTPGHDMLHGICIDIDELKCIQDARAALADKLRTEESRAQVTLQSIADGVITTDSAGSITGINAAAQRLTGWRDSDAAGRPAIDVLKVYAPAASETDPHGAALDPVGQCLAEGRTVLSQHNTTLTGRDGSHYTVAYSSAPVSEGTGQGTQGAVVVLHDTTEATSLMDNLSYQATHDSLTGLLNRAEFGRRLARTLERARADNPVKAALLYLDLDQFKIVNDTCGHSAGDDLLQQLAKQYQKHVRDRDTLARLGGDEFALILEHTAIEEAYVVANKVLETTRAFRYQCRGRFFKIGVSIGLIPIYAGTANVEDALRLADHACYIAKESGRNRIYVQVAGSVDVERRRNDMDWAAKLGEAFHNGRLQLFAQPIRALGASGGGSHYEVLLRLRDEHPPPVEPAMFLPAAERYDLMPHVDRWVFEKTIAWLSSDRAQIDHLELCSLNVSQRSLADEGFRNYALSLLSSTAVPAYKLCIEISESGAMANLHNTLSFMDKLKGLGCQFALDDFGTGLASFAYLKQIPVDFVKIDGSFVTMMSHSQVDYEMVKFTNDISHLMGRRTIAEYVQDRATLRRLRKIGVDFAQGYLVGAPKPLMQ